MLGGLYGDLPPPSDEDKPTNTTTTVWSIFAPPQTILKPQSKPKTTQNSLPTRPHSSPAIAPSPDDVVALPQPALVDVTSTVIKEHDPARPNDYEDYRREKKKKEVDAEISRELERRRQEEEEREMRERGNLVSTLMDNFEQVEEVDEVGELQDLQGAEMEENNEELVVEKVVEPTVGMSFDSPDEMFEYYKAFGLQEGFPVIRRSRRKGDDESLRYVTFACGRNGKSKAKPTNLEINEEVGIKMAQSFKSIVVKAGGFENVSFLERDARNRVDKVRRLRLGEEDAVAIQRVAYKDFGDVVTFDTTYLINKYDMSFAPFIGVNHHDQSILLGYQDKAMKNTVQIVFPNTKHRWCLWHILKKMPEKLGRYAEYHVIKVSLLSVVYNSHTPVEFEESWHDMLDKYDLRNNQWLNGLYEERNRWVPAFVKTTFWAGMSITQRSESMNAFFDGYVNSKTTLKQFVEKYEKAMESKIEKEWQVDARSFSQRLPCRTSFTMEKQVEEVYTIFKFQKFQQELVNKICCEDFSCGGLEYEAIENDEKSREKTFRVIFEKDEGEICCVCSMFEYKGILCKHAIAVLSRNRVQLLPKKYILRRLRKDVRRFSSKVKVSYAARSSSIKHQRYKEECIAFYDVAEVASKNEESHKNIMGWIEKVMKDVSLNVRCDGDDTTIDGGSSSNIQDPVVTRRKGRPSCQRKQKQFKRSK
ncbi:protein FAR1-RELATED SEQUENCE [Citrus sinensis]|uniref:Protein FAR1-RELATED SEQUENCE n=1 Tax=Citrus sinensis TaxID=2711 RepID=A0ACB8NBU6_CITSI|nr:protein FAR1-RELATED SEQUENCE [Citrus sinensis]